MVASNIIDSSMFDNDDIFNQFDHHPTPSRQQDGSSNTSKKASNRSFHKQNISKAEVLQKLTTMKSSLEAAWNVSCGGKKRKLKKLNMLKEIERKVEAYSDLVDLSPMYKNILVLPSCVPPVFGRNMNRLLDKQLQSTLEVINEIIDGKGDRDNSTHFTFGSSFDQDEHEYWMDIMKSKSRSCNASYCHFSSHSSSLGESSSSSTLTGSGISYDSSSSSFEGISIDGSDNVFNTTYNVENKELDPYGRSITTWSQRKLSNMECTESSDFGPEAEIASSSVDIHSFEGVRGGYDGHRSKISNISNISNRINGNSDVTVCARSRDRRVRFSGIKPSTDDYINRATELLNNARLMREKLNKK